MKILIHGINYSPELTGSGRYTGEMCEWIARSGADVKVVTAPPYYPDWRVHDGYSTFFYSKEKTAEKVKIIRCPLFVPQSPIAITRLIHLLSFAFSSFFPMMAQIFWRPQIIIVIEPTFFCSFSALLIAKLTGAKTILHIQDYELDAMFGLGMIRGGGYVARIAYAVERFFMAGFDRISTISHSMMNRARAKGVADEKLLFFPNWVDTDFITPDIDATIYRRKWGFNHSQKIVLYSGNIGHKQGLVAIIEAAESFQHNESVQFVIVGQGNMRDTLERLAREKGLKNVHFKDLVPYQRLPELIAMADVHLILQKKGTADAVLPSKLTTILSCGGQVLLTADKETELGLLVKNYPGIAKRVEPENLTALIETLKNMLSEDGSVINYVARDYAVKNLSRAIILDGFYQYISQLKK